MSYRADAVQLFGLWVALCSFPGCSRELIRLGDATEASSAIGGQAGSDGATAGGGGAAARGSAATAGDASAMAGAADDTAGAGGADTCPRAQILASEVLWIGDSWIQIPNGTQHNRVRDLARAAGAIGPNEDYVDLAAPAMFMTDIANQYAMQESGGTKVKVLLMDGGTWDPIAAQMSGASVPDAINHSVSAFQKFLAQVASDGTVQHIVYFLVPELSTVPGVATMRPLLQQACADSAVPCHFLDLQPLWMGHPEYTAPDGIQASVAGATLIGDSIWSIMRQNCIVQ